MSLANIQEPNSKQLYCGSLQLSGNLQTSGKYSLVDSADANIGSSLVADGSSMAVNSENYGSGTTTKIAEFDANNRHLVISGLSADSSNSGVNFGITGYSSQGTGQMYFDAGEVRFGANGTGAGVKIVGASGSGSIIVQGNITANNVPSIVSSVDWSGGGSSLSVSVAGLTEDDKVFVTPYAPPSGGHSFTHAVAGTGAFTIHLSGADTGNASKFHYHVMKAPPSA